MNNKKPMKVSEEFYNFIKRFGINRIKEGTDSSNRNLCDLPDIIVKYFKLNKDRYIELARMVVDDGTK